MSRAVAASSGGPLPESWPDRLEGFAHPSEVPVLFGQGAAEEALLTALQSGRMPHGWLLTGPEGVGKATLAYRLARFVLAGPDPVELARRSADLAQSETSPAFRRVARLSHANLLVLRRPWQERNKRFATAITVDEVRKLRSFLGTTAGSGPWRVVIVDRAEDMNVNAANALLKSLEEPPPRTVFLAVSSAPGRVPVTIRSRCRTLRLQRLGEAALGHAVADAIARSEAAEPDPASQARAIALADGSVRRTLELVGLGGGALYDRLIGVIAELPTLDRIAVHKLSEELTARDAEARFELAFALLGDCLARMVRHAATGAGAIGDETRIASRLAQHADLAQWAELWETVQRVKADALALNLDRKNLILDVFFRLANTARAARA